MPRPASGSAKTEGQLSHAGKKGSRMPRPIHGHWPVTAQPHMEASEPIKTLRPHKTEKILWGCCRPDSMSATASRRRAGHVWDPKRSQLSFAILRSATSGRALAYDGRAITERFVGRRIPSRCKDSADRLKAMTTHVRYKTQACLSRQRGRPSPASADAQVAWRTRRRGARPLPLRPPVEFARPRRLSPLRWSARGDGEPVGSPWAKLSDEAPSVWPSLR